MPVAGVVPRRRIPAVPVTRPPVELMAIEPLPLVVALMPVPAVTGAARGDADVPWRWNSQECR